MNRTYSIYASFFVAAFSGFLASSAFANCAPCAYGPDPEWRWRCEGGDPNRCSISQGGQRCDSTQPAPWCASGTIPARVAASTKRVVARADTVDKQHNLEHAAGYVGSNDSSVYAPNFIKVNDVVPAASDKFEHPALRKVIEGWRSYEGEGLELGQMTTSIVIPGNDIAARKLARDAGLHFGHPKAKPLFYRIEFSEPQPYGDLSVWKAKVFGGGSAVNINAFEGAFNVILQLVNTRENSYNVVRVDEISE